MKTAALFRAPEDAAASATRLAEAGFSAVLAPVFAPVAIDAALPDGRYAAALATSAKALEFAPALPPLDLYVVGEKTRAAAEGLGFTPRHVAPDAATLAHDFVKIFSEPERVVYFAGRDRKPDLERELTAAGFEIVTVEVYEMRARNSWSEAEIASLAQADFALHYSRRSAELAQDLAERAGLGETWRNLIHIAISADAAQPLQPLGANVIVAFAPNEQAMFAAAAAIR